MSKEIEKEQKLKLASERGRKSAEEGTKLLITVSLTCLGVFFVALTSKIDPPLTNAQKIISVIAVIAIGISSGSGLVSWLIDAKSHINWALALSQKERKKRSEHYKLRDKWKKIEKVNNKLFFIFFFIGILCGITYIILRILMI